MNQKNYLNLLGDVLNLPSEDLTRFVTDLINHSYLNKKSKVDLVLGIIERVNHDYLKEALKIINTKKRLNARCSKGHFFE